MVVATHTRAEFGPFQFDLETGELKRAGVPIKLQAQPARVLAVLIRRAGALVTRQELQKAIWGDHAVEFDQGLNFCVRQIRIALGDQAECPVFVETVPRVGYRFVARLVEPAPPVAFHPGPLAEGQPSPGEARRRWMLWVPAALALLLLSGWLVKARPLRTAEPVGARRMLVVLPFDNFSPDRTQDFFSDGLTEDLITSLSQLNPQQLGVIARTSAWRYKGEKKPVDQVKRELGVDYVLEGSVRTEAGTTRITVQLIRADDQSHLWSRTFDRPNSEWLQVQSEIAQSVARSLSLTLLARRASGGAFASESARESYLKARYHLGRPGPAAARQALLLFEETIKADPDCAPAYAGLAAAQMRQSIPPRQMASQARAALGHALRLDDNLAEAHSLSGQLALRTELDWTRARREFERALALEPGRAETYLEYAFYFSNLGQHDEAIGLLRRALALDPVSPLLLGDLGWIYLRAEQYDEAVQQSLKALELESDDVGAQYCLFRAYLQQGKEAEALARAREVMRLAGAPAAAFSALDEGGVAAYQRWELEWLLEGSQKRYVDPAVLAMSYADVGQTEKAIQCLLEAATQGSSFLASLRAEHRFAPLRADPRFLALIRRLFPA